MSSIELIRRRYADLSPTDPRFRLAMELASREANAVTCDRESWCDGCGDWIEPTEPHFITDGVTVCNECDSTRRVLSGQGNDTI